MIDSGGYTDFAWAIPAGSPLNDNCFRIRAGPDSDAGSSTGNTVLRRTINGNSTALDEGVTVPTGSPLDIAASYTDNGDGTVDLDVIVWEYDGSEWVDALALSASGVSASELIGERGVGYAHNNGGNALYDGYRFAESPGDHTTKPEWTP